MDLPLVVTLCAATIFVCLLALIIIHVSRLQRRDELFEEVPNMSESKPHKKGTAVKTKSREKGAAIPLSEASHWRHLSIRRQIEAVIQYTLVIITVALTYWELLRDTIRALVALIPSI